MNLQAQVRPYLPDRCEHTGWGAVHPGECPMCWVLAERARFVAWLESNPTGRACDCSKWLADMARQGELPE